MMIRSKYADGGKSPIAKHLNELGHNTPLVVPQNNLSQYTDHDAVTTNKFSPYPRGAGKELPEFDHSSYTCIGFGEIYESHTYPKQDQRV